MLIVLTVVMVAQLYLYAKTYQSVHFKYLSLINANSTSIKLLKSTWSHRSRARRPVCAAEQKVSQRWPCGGDDEAGHTTALTLGTAAGFARGLPQPLLSLQ